MQNKCNSIAITLELLIFCIKSSIFRGCNSGNGKVNDCFRSKLLPSDMCVFLHTAPSSPDGEDRSVTPPSASSSSGGATPSANIGKCTTIVALFSSYSFTFLAYNIFFQSSHWGWHKMAFILQTTSWNSCFSVKIVVSLQFPLTITHYWLR